MNPKKIIEDAVDNEDYEITEHCINEMDKDGLSIEQIDCVMKYGNIVKYNRIQGRYTLKKDGIMISVEIDSRFQCCVVTVGRKRRKANE